MHTHIEIDGAKPNVGYSNKEYIFNTLDSFKNLSVFLVVHDWASFELSDFQPNSIDRVMNASKLKKLDEEKIIGNVILLI